MNGVNVERFAHILAKRWKRNPYYRAADLPELKKLSGSYPLPGSSRDAIHHTIEIRAREIFETSNNKEQL